MMTVRTFCRHEFSEIRRFLGLTIKALEEPADCTFQMSQRSKQSGRDERLPQSIDRSKIQQSAAPEAVEVKQ
jgi:hypothetical protein